MAGRRPVKPKSQVLVQVPAVEDANTQRALDVLVSAVQQLQSNRAAPAIPVTGSRSSGAALESLIEALVAAGIITDETTA